MHGGREAARVLSRGVCASVPRMRWPVRGSTPTHERSRNAHAQSIRWPAWRFPRTARTAAAGRNGATATGRCASWDGAAWRRRATATGRGSPWDGTAWRSAAAAAAAGIGPGRVTVRVVGTRHRFGLLSCCACCHELLSSLLCLRRADDLLLSLLIVWVPFTLWQSPWQSPWSAAC